MATSLSTDHTSSVNVLFRLISVLVMWYPNGSVIGPLIFSIYLRPMFKSVYTFPNISYHIYANDIQLFIKLHIFVMDLNSELINYSTEIICF